MRLSSSRIILGSLLAFAQFACGGSDSGTTDDTSEVGGTTSVGTTQPTSSGGQGSAITSGAGGGTVKSTTSALGGRTASSAGGAATAGSSSATGGTAGTPGSSTQGSTSSGGTTSTGGSTSAGGTTTGSTSGLAKFSFFVTSQTALLALAGNSNGFGGDLRYGLSDGLSGADKICATIAEQSMPGSGAKQWRAFLSVTAGPSGTPVNAIDRVGTGPWYDRLGRLVANTKQDLLSARPATADTVIKNDLPNETGTPNHYASGSPVDNHDVLTGTNTSGGDRHDIARQHVQRLDEFHRFHRQATDWPFLATNSDFRHQLDVGSHGSGMCRWREHREPKRHGKLRRLFRWLRSHLLLRTQSLTKRLEHPRLPITPERT
ncbi:MAG: hypothetical protein QM784_17040 [Polyangiaceae bacterium]